MAATSNEARAASNAAAAGLFRLDGQVALVTGAGRGIGAEIALQLARAGAELVLVSRTESELQQVAKQIEAEGGRARVAVCDVTDSAGVRALIAELPQLDIVVNNAGNNIPEPFVEVSEAHLDALIDLNTRAVFVVAQAAVRRMLTPPRPGTSGGCVINISSQMGHIGSPNRTVYCMTKHAVEGLTKAMAVELAPNGIRVNSIGPTFVDTPLVRRIVDTPEKSRFVLSNIPLGRLASVTEIAAAAVYLASPAAAMVTGTCLRVDGGWTAQ
ncbi:SDR family NAD(P)-dependent oxidoreductase [Piscinibacter sakaiensis]|uniref:SDR family NAD(P)-dependent oxidoreductase n=1 Tax=Piscinibacter sakaiensis TaxID=1547922 RepID=UPI003AADACEF